MLGPRRAAAYARNNQMAVLSTGGIAYPIYWSSLGRETAQMTALMDLHSNKCAGLRE